MKELIFGLDCVRGALTTNRRRIYKLLIYQSIEKSAQTESIQNIFDLALKRGILIQYTTRKELDILLQDRPHQNVALEVSKFEPAVIDEPPKSPESQFIVFPVNLLDPQNLGSIIRSSTFFGCTTIVTSLKRSCDYTPIVSKASAGCMETFPNLFRTKSPLQFLKNAKESGFKIIGTGLKRNDIEFSNSHSLNPNRTVLLLGNEGHGLGDEILSICDDNIQISPQFNTNSTGLDSLNVAVATGILLDRLKCRNEKEDFPALDVASAIVGNFEAQAQLILKSDKCFLAGRPFVDGIFEYVNCRVHWHFEEGQKINFAQPIALVTGPACNILRAERIALNLLARCSSIATNARNLASQTTAQLAGTRKTIPGFRLFEKYSLAVGGIDTHRFSCTDCIMLKDNHIDLLGEDIPTILNRAKSLASFTSKIEVECRSLDQAITATTSGADIVMLDNFLPSDHDILRLKDINPNVIIELSGGITERNISSYPNESVVLSLGALTHSIPPLLDFSLKIVKVEQ